MVKGKDKETANSDGPESASSPTPQQGDTGTSMVGRQQGQQPQPRDTLNALWTCTHETRTYHKTWELHTSAG